MDRYYQAVNEKTHDELGAVALVAICMRLLFYTLTFESMGLFVLGFMSTFSVTGQFLMGFVCVIISFSAALNSLYGAYSTDFSKLNEYFSSTKIALAGMHHLFV